MKTEKMKEFIAKNKKHKIVLGERLTPEGKTIFTKEDLERSDRVRYKFVDGSSFDLLYEDAKSAPNFKPIWLFD